MLQSIRRVIPLIVLLGLLTPVARADDGADAKKAVDSFVTAWKSGDEKAIKATLVISPQWEKQVDAVVDSIAAISRLQKAAATKFGAAATEYFAEASTQFDARMKAIKDGPVKIAGESAILTIPADDVAKTKGGTLVLKKSGGAWKIDAAGLFDMTPETQKQTAELVALSNKLTPIANQMTKEITDGKYGAAVDAYQEFFTRFTAAMKELDKPAPAPMPVATTATKPATH